MNKLLRGLLLSSVTLIVLDQALQHLVLGSRPDLGGRPLAPFDPPLFHEGQRQSLARIRAQVESGGERLADVRFDPLLGWCSEPGYRGEVMQYDWAGCRIATDETLREKDPARTRVVLIGGSFTRGDEVAATESWAARLGEARPDLELCNLGMGAYGLDQALLRYERDGAPLEPEEVWIGFMPQASLRCVSVYRPALRHWTNAVAFKPRFALDTHHGAMWGGALYRVPNPVQSLEDITRLLSDQEAFLEAVGGDDFWIERARSAYLPRGSHFSHHSALARIAATLHEKGQRAAPDWMDDKESEPYRVVEALLHRARALTAGTRLRVVVVPGRSDLQGTSRWWRGLLAEVFPAEGDVLDLSLELDDGFGADPSMWAPGGHYSAAGNARIAELLAQRLR